MLEKISGGVCAARGFSASGVHCGIRKSRSKKDLALIYSSLPATSAAVYTTNLVKGAPLIITKENLSNSRAQAVICNSGNANTCSEDGLKIARQMCHSLAYKLGISDKDVIVASTGVIGQKLDIEAIKSGIEPLIDSLSPDGSDAASEGIMTTDTTKKEVAYKFDIDGIECRIGGIAKGSGMIHPNMATMLVFITTDVAISARLLKKALRSDVKDTFNMVSVDGDTSTNDMVAVMANGMSGNKKIIFASKAYQKFCNALRAVNSELCSMIARDGEGATKLLKCQVNSAKSTPIAKKVAKSVVCSSLLKAAMFGSDANWGRVLCAIGYSGVKLDVSKIDVNFKSSAGEIEVCKNGVGVDFSEEKAKEILSAKEIEIIVSLNSGAASALAYGCDLTYDYVKINGDYRS